MLWTAAQAQAIDASSTRDFGRPSLELMEEAGKAVFQLLLRLWRPHSHIVILAGPGNNGGDALVAARHLHQAGFAPHVLDVRDPGSPESPERLFQREALEALGLALFPFENAASLAPFHVPRLLVLDGLLGIGFKGKLRPGRIQDCLQACASLKADRVLAIDLPSGLDADAWQQNEALLPASDTITFGAAKAVHFLDPSRKDCGLLHIVPLSFAPDAIKTILQAAPFTLSLAKASPGLTAHWKGLPQDAHKFSRGHGLIVGGSAGKLGAPLFSAMAAMRGGMGWVSVAPMSEAFAPPWPIGCTYEAFALEGQIDSEALCRFIESRKVKVLAIGPGTTQQPLTRELLKKLQQLNHYAGLFLILDAGALHGFAALCGDDLRFDPRRTLLTPHPGEWQKIGENMPQLHSLHDLPAALALCEKWGVSVIYKSSTPLCLSEKRVSVLTEGSLALAKAGSGDVLAGLAMALAASGLPAFEAAVYAQSLVAQAAKRAAGERSLHSLSASDILNSIA